MIGQEELLNRLTSYNISNLPHSLLFIGEEGCGKHTLALELSKYFDIPLRDITEDLSLDLINTILTSSVKTFYLININELNNKEQNMILKFLEEPTESVYIILIVTQLVNIIKTVENRCVSFKFKPYSMDELSAFIKNPGDEVLLKYCETPGQIVNTNSSNIEQLVNLCDTIINHIDSANYSNALSITNKMNFKDEYDKFDVNLFFKLLGEKILDKYLVEQKTIYVEMINLISQAKLKMANYRCNKENIFNEFISKIWRLARNYDFK